MTEDRLQYMTPALASEIGRLQTTLINLAHELEVAVHGRTDAFAETCREDVRGALRQARRTVDDMIAEQKRNGQG